MWRFVCLQVQDHIGDMQLRHEGHLLVPARGGALAVQNTQCRECSSQGAHLRYESLNWSRLDVQSRFGRISHILSSSFLAFIGKYRMHRADV